MSRVAARATSDPIMDEENGENIPPQGRRSERVKGRKGASNNNFGNITFKAY